MDGIHLLGEWYDCPADTPEITRAESLRSLCLEAVAANDRAEATRRFPVGTVEGDLIRSTVPTTYTPPPEVGPGQITTVMASGTEIHADATALHATKFTWFHQAPGSPAFLVIATGAPGSLTLHNQAPGVHRLKAAGANSGGEGAPSAAVEVTIAQQAAA